jgi:signal transduction histidine kinase
MRGRVADLGGRLQVTSTPGRGTVLRVEVPAHQ